MRFDINNTGKYIFDQRQNITTKDMIELEDEYYFKIRSNPSLLNKNVSITNVADKANTIVTYIIVGIAIILPLLSWFVFFGGMSGYQKIFLTIGLPCTGIGIALFVKLYLRLTAIKRVYSETVEAECIGYARFFDVDSGENTMPKSGTPCVSPVFTYQYKGNQYTSCFDGFELSRDCSVALGPAKIEISPEDPESVFNRKAQHTDEIILFAVVFFLAGIGSTIAGLML